MRRADLALGVVATLVTIATWTAFIVGSRALAARSLQPLDVVTLRFVVAAVLLAPWGWWLVRRRGGGWLGVSPAPARQTIALGLFGGVIFGLLAYHGFALAPASHSAVLMPGLLPLWATLFAWLINGERAGPQRLFGLALIIAGALLVGGLALSSALEGGRVWIGDLLYLFAPLTWAIFTSLCRRWEIGPVEATTAVSLFSAVTLGLPYLLAVLAGWVQSGLAIAPVSEIVTQALLQGVMGVIVSGIGFMKMVQVFGPVRATMLTAMVPAIAAGSAVLFLDEPFTWMLGAGLVCVTLGIIVGVGGAARAAPAAGRPGA
jgi:drug/metabolite transporter (DMT)-like permease